MHKASATSFTTKHFPAKPYLVLPKYKTVIFIHGCFWHGHENCNYFKIPQTRTEWWTEKINKNVANDLKAIKTLKEEGWKMENYYPVGVRSQVRQNP